jgi:hypothetical protein
MTAQSKVETATLASSMAQAFAEIEAATKSANNPHFKSKYADLGAVIEAVKPALIKHGLFFTQRSHPADHGVSVETVLHHACGEELSLGTLYVPANKQDAQGFGSALTYARRYGLMTAFGVPAEDDDGNAAAASAPARSNTGDRINDSQVGILQGYASGGVIDAGRFCSFFQIPSLKDLPASRYEEALAMAQAKQEKARQKEPANA